MKQVPCLFWALMSILVVGVPSVHAQADGAAPPIAEGADADSLSRRLEAIDESLSAITQMRARFRQTRRIAMLRHPLESSGTVLLKDDSIRWDTLEPAASTMLVRSGEIQIYYPDSAILEIYKSDSAQVPVQARGIRPRLAQLHERFSIAEIPVSFFGAQSDADLLGLELVPLGGGPNSQAEIVRVLIDTAIPMILRIQMTSSEGDLTDIELLDLRFDQPISEEEMELEIAAGTLVSRPMSGELEPANEDADLESEGEADPASEGSL